MKNLIKKEVKKLTEIKKITKIALVYNAIVTFLFAILLIFLTELFITPLTG